MLVPINVILHAKQLELGVPAAVCLWQESIQPFLIVKLGHH